MLSFQISLWCIKIERERYIASTLSATAKLILNAINGRENLLNLILSHCQVFSHISQIFKIMGNMKFMLFILTINYFCYNYFSSTTILLLRLLFSYDIKTHVYRVYNNINGNIIQWTILSNLCNILDDITTYIIYN